MSGNQTAPEALLGLRSVAKVHAHTRLSETTEAIRRLVLDGVVPTGGRLKDQDVAAALGVSRATVREAVRQLVHEGILVHEPYKGLRVASMDDETYFDLSEVRAALEVLGAQRVGANLTPQIEAQLEASITRLRKATDMASFNEAHFGFHALLQHLAGSEILEQTWGIVERRARAGMRIDYEIAPALDRVSPHVDILEAIRTRDRDGIARAIEEHVLASAQDRVGRRHALEERPEVGAEVTRHLMPRPPRPVIELADTVSTSGPLAKRMTDDRSRSRQARAGHRPAVARPAPMTRLVGSPRAVYGSVSRPCTETCSGRRISVTRR